MTKPQILIKGPTVRGTFFIADSRNRIWDGEQWRGFGMAEDFFTYKEAFAEVRRIKTIENRALRPSLGP